MNLFKLTQWRALIAWHESHECLSNEQETKKRNKNEKKHRTRQNCGNRLRHSTERQAQNSRFEVRICLTKAHPKYSPGQWILKIVSAVSFVSITHIFFCREFEIFIFEHVTLCYFIQKNVVKNRKVSKTITQSEIQHHGIFSGIRIEREKWKTLSIEFQRFGFPNSWRKISVW